MIAWTFPNAEVACRFYQVCLELGIDDEAGKVEILKDFAKNGEMANVVETSRSRDEFVQDLARHYKVLDIQRSNTNEL